MFPGNILLALDFYSFGIA